MAFKKNRLPFNEVLDSRDRTAMMLRDMDISNVHPKTHQGILTRVANQRGLRTGLVWIGNGVRSMDKARNSKGLRNFTSNMDDALIGQSMLGKRRRAKEYSPI